MTGEQITTLIICGVAMAPLLVICGVLLSGRGGFLVAGYNTMSPEQKRRWNVKALCRFTGALVLVFSLLLMAAVLCAVLKLMAAFIVLASVACAVVLAGVVFINKSGRFKNPQ